MYPFKNKLCELETALYFSFISLCALLPFQFALNPSPGFDLAIVRVIIPIMFFGLLIVQLRKKPLQTKSDLMTYLVVTFGILALVSLSFSHNLFWSFRKLLFLFSIAPIYFIATSLLKNRVRQRAAIAALVAGATAVAIIGIIQFIAQFIFGIDPVYAFLAKYIAPFFLGKSFGAAVLAYPSWLVNSGGTTYMRATATFPDPHMLSYYFGMLAPWSIALAVTSKNKSKWLFLPPLLLIVADICTFTRGGYLALIAGAFVIIPLVSRSTAKKIFLGAAILFMFFTITPSSPVTGRLASSFDVQEGSNQGRLSNWQQALLIMKTHPLGVGIGMYSLTVDPNADYREPIYAHDLYFDVTAELGIQTAILLIIMLYLTLTSFWTTAKKQTFFIAGVSSITIFSIHSLVETPLYSVHIFTLLLIIIALGTITKKYETER